MPTLPVRELQLATLVSEPPEGTGWLHEQKLDGYRIVAVREGRRVTLLSRRFKDWTDTFPAIAEAVATVTPDRVTLDGEVCVLAPDGRTSFQLLQNALGGQRANLVYFAFDVLSIGGEPTHARPLIERKAALAQLLQGKGVSKRLRFSDHVEGNGAKFFALACRTGLEGIISKRRDQAYAPGRGGGWLKTKCLQRQELVIAGYTEPAGSRAGFGSLLLGYYDEQQLRFAGKVGTGFSQRVLAQVHASLEKLERATSPFTPEPTRALTGPRRHWCEPRLVCEVTFTEWTADGRLRHPSFQGLRLDKLPEDVVREEPKPR